MSDGSFTPTPEGDAALARAQDAGIHRLAIPTPFQVGPVNCYLIEDDPLTLVDTGPNSGVALDDLERKLADLGRSVEDVELVAITHQHLDHLGLTDIIVRRSGAAVTALDLLAPYVAAFERGSRADDEFAADLMRRYGVSNDVVVALKAVSAAAQGWGCDVEVTRPLKEGDHIELANRSFEVLHRPGHSPTDTVFWDSETRLLLGGDHLIKHISSNPLIARKLDGDGGERIHSLEVYLRSMTATKDMPIDAVLPGHGEPVTEHAALIDQRFQMHLRRAEKIYKLIDEKPRGAHELAQDMWGNIAFTQVFLTLSEVIGHADLLMSAGRIVEVEDDEGIARYEVAP